VVYRELVGKCNRIDCKVGKKFDRTANARQELVSEYCRSERSAGLPMWRDYMSCPEDSSNKGIIRERSWLFS
jgi:hypothetical protein